MWLRINRIVGATRIKQIPHLFKGEDIRSLNYASQTCSGVGIPAYGCVRKNALNLAYTSIDVGFHKK